MRALSIRQPYAELILRGTKRIEYRTWRTTIIGERFHIYAARKPDPEQDDDPATEARRIWSNDLAVPRSARRGGSARDGEPPRWMLELAARLISKDLPTGVIVGSAVIEKVTEGDELFEWHLTGARRAERLAQAHRPPPAGMVPAVLTPAERAAAALTRRPSRERPSPRRPPPPPPPHPHPPPRTRQRDGSDPANIPQDLTRPAMMRQQMETNRISRAVISAGCF